MSPRAKPLPPPEEESTAPASEAAPALPPASTAAVAAIDTEFARDKDKRHSSIDPAKLRPQHTVLRNAIEAAKPHLRPGAPDQLPGFLFAYDRAFASFEKGLQDAARAIPGQRIYSKATRAIAKNEAFPIFKEIRDRAGERLANVAGAEDLRTFLGTSSGIAATAPQDVLSGIENQQAALQSDKWIPMLEGAGLFPAVWREQLDPIVPRLQKSIRDGVADETKFGDAQSDVQEALLELDITLSRAGAFIAAWASPKDAQAIEEATPRLHAKPATTPDNPPVTPGTQTEAKPAEKKAPPPGEAAKAGEQAKTSDTPPGKAPETTAEKPPDTPKAESTDPKTTKADAPKT